MVIDERIRDKKLQYDINREAEKIAAAASSSGKINKHGYLTGEGVVSSNQSRIIKQAKFTYCPLEKAFEKQIKTKEEIKLKF